MNSIIQDLIQSTAPLLELIDSVNLVFLAVLTFVSVRLADYFPYHERTRLNAGRIAAAFLVAYVVRWYLVADQDEVAGLLGALIRGALAAVLLFVISVIVLPMAATVLALYHSVVFWAAAQAAKGITVVALIRQHFRRVPPALPSPPSPTPTELKRQGIQSVTHDYELDEQLLASDTKLKPHERRVVADAIKRKYLRGLARFFS